MLNNSSSPNELQISNPVDELYPRRPRVRPLLSNCPQGWRCALAAYCIESGDDLGPFYVGFGRVDWVGVDGLLMGHLFHCGLGLSKVVKKKFFNPLHFLRLHTRHPPRTHG